MNFIRLCFQKGFNSEVPAEQTNGELLSFSLLICYFIPQDCILEKEGGAKGFLRYKLASSGRYTDSENKSTPTSEQFVICHHSTVASSEDSLSTDECNMIST